MSAHEETLEEWFKEARTDYLAGDPSASVKWAFKAARAKGERLVADRELRMLERVEEHCYNRATHLEAIGSEAGYAVALMHLPPPAVAGQVRAAMSKAVEKETAADSVMCLLAKLPAKAEAKAEATRFATGGRR